MSANDINIIRATPADAEGVTEVVYQGWLFSHLNEERGVGLTDIEEWFGHKRAEARLIRLRKRHRVRPASDHLFVAKAGGLVVGVCRIGRRPRNEECNQVYSLYVLPKYHGMGIGTALLTFAERYFDPTCPTILGVAVYNARAIDFYLRQGFVMTDRCLREPKAIRLASGATIPLAEMERPARQVAGLGARLLSEPA